MRALQSKWEYIRNTDTRYEKVCAKLFQNDLSATVSLQNTHLGNNIIPEPPIHSNTELYRASLRWPRLQLRSNRGLAIDGHANWMRHLLENQPAQWIMVNLLKQFLNPFLILGDWLWYRFFIARPSSAKSVCRKKNKSNSKGKAISLLCLMIRP